MNSYFIFRDSVVVHADDKTFTIAKSDPRYTEVLLQIVSKRLDKLSSLSNAEYEKQIKSLLGL